MPFRLRTPWLVSLMVPGLLLSTGCVDALKAFEEERNQLHVLTTHHATALDGQFPDLGGDDLPRVWTNDQGWQITLTEAYAVTTGMTVVGCNNQTIGLDMYWGPCAEDMNLADLSTVTVAGASLDAGQFCKVVVQYSPYDPNAPSGGDSKHPPPEAEEIVGATIFLNGFAENSAGDKVGFTLLNHDTRLVELDMSTIENGGPVTISPDNFPEEITISKAYDRFFDGVDFSTYDPDELSGRLIDILAAQTRVSHGALVSMD